MNRLWVTGRIRVSGLCDEGLVEVVMMCGVMDVRKKGCAVVTWMVVVCRSSNGFVV